MQVEYVYDNGQTIHVFVEGGPSNGRREPQFADYFKPKQGHHPWTHFSGRTVSKEEWKEVSRAFLEYIHAGKAKWVNPETGETPGPRPGVVTIGDDLMLAGPWYAGLW